MAVFYKLRAEFYWLFGFRLGRDISCLIAKLVCDGNDIAFGATFMAITGTGVGIDVQMFFTITAISVTVIKNTISD
ncbi:hypothetical protein HZA73_07210 [candidate division TA06 bacterium]|nr:hypothetical protein [candidate division TA06 bacterium]